MRLSILERLQTSCRQQVGVSLPAQAFFLRVGREKFLLAHAKMKVGANVTFVIVILFS